MTYNEYWQLIDAGMKASDLIVFKYENEHVATLEDGIYTLDSKLKDSAMVDKLVRFLRASIKGWDYAIKHQPEAVKIVLANDTTGAQNEHHQTQMMGEIAKLVADQPKGLGYLEPADYQRTVDELLKGSSDPVITKKPAGAWTHSVWEKAAAK
jgi:NitT/TauT family transport system substrate-binding protein